MWAMQLLSLAAAAAASATKASEAGYTAHYGHALIHEVMIEDEAVCIAHLNRLACKRRPSDVYIDPAR